MLFFKVVDPLKYSRVMFEIVELPGSCASPEKHYIPCSGRTIMATCYFFHDFRMKINENWVKTDKQVKDEKIYGLHINFLWTSNLKKTSQIKPKVSPKNNLFGLKTVLPVIHKHFPTFTYLCFSHHTSDSSTGSCCLHLDV